MDKRYQVFVSSTYADLKQERARVIQTVIEMDCIPAGMELFPAADEEQFAFIKRVIDDCDYYLLIIGGRYGSTAADGTSYTEKEYDYAISRGLKVIALVHEDPNSIPLGKSEQDPVLRGRLQKFREKVTTNRLVKFWKTAEDLPGLVALSLAYSVKMFPAVGWVRANKAASEDLLAEINDLRKVNAQLQASVTELAGIPEVVIPDLASLDDNMDFHGTYHSTYSNREGHWTATASWREVFGYISPYLRRHPNAEYVAAILRQALFERSHNSGYKVTFNDQEFQTVSLQMNALGLVKIEYSEKVGGGYGLFWLLTPAGERLMMEIRTVRKASGQDKS